MKSNFFFEFAIINHVKFLKSIITHWKQKSKSCKGHHRILWFFWFFWTYFGRNLNLTNFDIFGHFWDIGAGPWALVGITRAWPYGSKVPPIIPTNFAKKVSQNSRTHLGGKPASYFRCMLKMRKSTMSISNKKEVCIR